MGTTIKGCCKPCKEDKTYDFEQNLSQDYKDQRQINQIGYEDSELSRSISSVIKYNIAMLDEKSKEKSIMNDLNADEEDDQVEDMDHIDNQQISPRKESFFNRKKEGESLESSEIQFVQRGKTGNSEYKRMYIKPSNKVDASILSIISTLEIYKRIIAKKQVILSQDEGTILVEGKIKMMYSTGIKHIKNSKEIYLVLYPTCLKLYKSKESFIDMSKSLRYVALSDITEMKLQNKGDLFSIEYMKQKENYIKDLIELSAINKHIYFEFICLVYILNEHYNNNTSKHKNESFDKQIA